MSLPDVADETAFLRIQRIVDAVGRVSGVEIALGAVPTALLARSKVPAGPAEGNARSLMAQALSATRTALTWRLLYAPDAARWFLNVHAVDRPHIGTPPKQR